MKNHVSTAKQEVDSYRILILGTGKSQLSVIGSVSSPCSCSVKCFTKSCLNKDDGSKYLSLTGYKCRLSEVEWKKSGVY